ncbi:MAG: DUF1186 family protein [Candidatus Eremiobacteraeota bacterium]|nr:DUF1186 family protein [Candidatus Eremiobacteraeota bacterium]
MPAPLSPAVTRLCTTGDPGAWDAPWPDYPAEYDLTRDDVPALLDMALDATPHHEGDPAVWAPLHAWRALGELGAPEAAEPMTGLLARVAGPDQDDDWALTELPRVLAMLGLPALAPVQQLLNDATLDSLVRGAAAETLGWLAAETPEARAATVAALTDLLARSDTDPEMAAFTISALIRAGAVEAAPAIETAFAADRVEWSINGDWEDVQLALGLITERRTPRPRYLPPALDALSAFDSERSGESLPPNPDVGTAAERARVRAKTKSKRKAAARARQANRRKR